MSFKVSKNRTFTHDVTVLTPIDGGHREETLKPTFNFLGVDEVAAFDLSTRQGTTEFLKAIVPTLDGFTDQHEKPLPISEELRDQHLQMNNVRQALLRHYFAAVAKDPAAGN